MVKLVSSRRAPSFAEEKKLKAIREGEEVKPEDKGAEDRLRDAERALEGLTNQKKEVTKLLESPDEAVRKEAETELELLDAAIADEERKRGQAAEEVETLGPELEKVEKKG